jgi:hypothetical protein
LKLLSFFYIRSKTIIFNPIDNDVIEFIINSVMADPTIERKHSIKVYLSDEEFEVIKEMADREGLTYAEYMRVAVMCDACMSANKKAWLVTFNNASRKAKEFVRKKSYLGKSYLGKIYLGKQT